VKKKGFTLIELLVVIAIIAILAVIALLAYNKFVKVAECSGYKEQHKKVVSLAKETYGFCSLNGYTNMNITAPCMTNSNGIRALKRNSGMTQIRQDGNKCVRSWNCKFRSGENAGRSSGWFVTHSRAEFNTPNHTGGFIREDQWQNFRKPNYPERAGITNIREKGVKMEIATYLGSDCSGGNFTN
jgi:prepilin-type N-terminal cleavage/methylation domain-containing protein